jgi:hypothetical protein
MRKENPLIRLAARRELGGPQKQAKRRPLLPQNELADPQLTSDTKFDRKIRALANLSYFVKFGEN